MGDDDERGLSRGAVTATVGRDVRSPSPPQLTIILLRNQRMNSGFEGVGRAFL